MTQPIVSIVIPAYNASKTISATIEGCKKQNYPKDKLEIIVVDDGSKDNTTSVVKALNVRCITQENGGPSKARNTGARNAAGEIVAFCDSDCVPRKRWISKMVALYTTNDIVCVGSRYGIANRRNLLACCIYFEFLIRYKRMPRFPKFLGSHGYSFRKDYLLRLGGYSEEYKMASHEDNELVCRIVKDGHYPLFDKSNIVDHFFPTNFYKYMRIQMWHGYWRMKLYADHPRMVTGDDYSDIWDYLQPPLALLFVTLLPLSWISSIFWFEWLIFIIIIALQLPIALGIIRLTRKRRYMCYVPFGIFRACVRSIGMMRGIYVFWVKRILDSSGRKQR